MAEHDEHERVWDIIEKVGVGMLATRSADGLRARPLEPRPDRTAGIIWFLTDDRSGKDHEIEAHSEVCLVVIDVKDKAYLSITGHAEVLRDTAQAAVIWRESDRTWWPGGPDDPNLRVLRLTPQRAELWDGPASSAVAAFELVKARLTGEKPNLGENRKVTVEMK
jgi:general stress protein 26